MSGQHLLIGPANYAGQASAYAAALRNELGIRASSVTRRLPGRPVAFTADIEINGLRWATDPMWRRQWRRRVVGEFSHVILDGGLPLVHGGMRLGPGLRPYASRDGLSKDVSMLASHGIDLRLLFHGTEVRSPARHADWEQFSPYRRLDARELTRLSEIAERCRALSAEVGSSTLVTTPDLVLDVPGATWIPLVRNPSDWQATRQIALDRPVVLHAPTNATMAGSANLEPVLQQMNAEGLITYRRVVGAPPSTMRALVDGADVVVDKCSIGSYGVISVEAMMLGRVAMGHVHDDVRDIVRNRFGLELPIVEITPDSARETILRAINAPDEAHSTAERGRQFALKVHSGQESARLLSVALGIRKSEWR